MTLSKNLGIPIPTVACIELPLAASRYSAVLQPFPVPLQTWGEQTDSPSGSEFQPALPFTKETVSDCKTSYAQRSQYPLIKEYTLN